MNENISMDPENEATVVVEKETTRMSIIHMAIIAIIVTGLIFAIVLLALFTPTDISSKFAQMFPSPAPKTEEALEPTATPEVAPEKSSEPTGSALPKATASVTPVASATPTPSPTPSPTPMIKTINAPAGQDGSVTDTGYANATGYIDVGRTPDFIYRGFVGFDISEIPATAKISKATLRLYQRTVTGTPYASLGNLMVDHLDSGTTLTADSYAGGNLYEASFASMGSNQIGEWKILDVTKQVTKDRSLHTSSQFRLHFATETKGGTAPGDIAEFSSANNGSEAPQLIVEYN